MNRENEEKYWELQAARGVVLRQMHAAFAASDNAMDLHKAEKLRGQELRERAEQLERAANALR